MSNSGRREFLVGAGAAASWSAMGRPAPAQAAEPTAAGSTDLPRGMTLVTLRRGGEPSLGVKTDRGILDVRLAERMFRQNAPVTIDEVFQRGGGPELQRLVQSARDEAGFHLDEAKVEFGPCVTRPEKIVCVGLNYRKHAEETGQPVPKQPILFNKYNTALNGHRRRDPGLRGAGGAVRLRGGAGRGDREGRRGASARRTRSPTCSATARATTSPPATSSASRASGCWARRSTAPPPSAPTWSPPTRSETPIGSSWSAASTVSCGSPRIPRTWCSTARAWSATSRSTSR